MKNIKKRLAIISLSLCSGFVFAQAPKPASCPQISALQSVPMDAAEYVDRLNVWAAGVYSNNYGTEVNWSFGIFGIKAKTAQQAIKKSKSIIAHMRLTDGPAYDENQDSWYCEYYTPNHIMGIAITPAASMADTIKMAKHIK